MGILEIMKHGHAEPVADEHYALAVKEIEMLRNALEIADAAINPRDLGGLSLDRWNQRLKSATATIRAALASDDVAEKRPDDLPPGSDREPEYLKQRREHPNE